MDGQGARTDIEPQDGAVPKLTRTQAATAAGLSERQRKTAIRVANVPPSPDVPLRARGGPTKQCCLNLRHDCPPARAGKSEVWGALHADRNQVEQFVPPEIGYKSPPPQSRAFAAESAEKTGRSKKDINRSIRSGGGGIGAWLRLASESVRWVIVLPRHRCLSDQSLSYPGIGVLLIRGW